MVDNHGPVHGLKMSPWATSLEKMQKMIVALLRLHLSPQSRHERKAKSLQGPPAHAPERPCLTDDEEELE